VVRPALQAGRHVVSDRSVYSTLAYQGYGRGLPLDELRQINEWAMAGIWPDLVVLLKVPQDVSAERLRKRQLDRFERAGDDFHDRVVRGYAAMAKAEPERWVVVDATHPKDDVSAAIRIEVRERLRL
jgi:dTMP kinase